MAKSNKNRPIPLTMIEYTVNILGPSIWDKIDRYHEIHHHEWDDRCYIPMTDLVSNILFPDYPVTVSEKTPYPMVAALAAWRRCKEIYRFDPDFAELLMADADINSQIPYDALAHLPFSCFYVELPIDKFDGFFVFFEYDSGVIELRLDMVSRKIQDGTIVASLNMVGETLADGIEESLRHVRFSLRKQAKITGVREIESLIGQYEEFAKSYIPSVLQLVLYLCAENAEIKENEQQKVITRRGSVIKDQFREIRKWDVGSDAGIRIRRHYASKGSNFGKAGHNSHASPTPHMRRAHWHHFWVGKRNSEERQLILRWIPPTFVSGDGQADIAITINEIENTQNPKITSRKTVF